MVRILPATDRSCVEEAVRLLRQGGLVCLPTDTVYGLGAAASQDGAIRRLYAVKGRPLDKPLPLLLAEPGSATWVAEVSPVAKRLMDRFWPGALTIVMRKAGSFRSLALAGGNTVALRVPEHSLVREVIRVLGEPVTGTSANRGGAPAPLEAGAAAFQLGEMVDLIIDGGRCGGGRESTVIDITQDGPCLLREGPVSREEIEEALGRQVGA